MHDFEENPLNLKLHLVSMTKPNSCKNNCPSTVKVTVKILKFILQAM